MYLLFKIFGCAGSSLLHMGFLQLWRAGATLQLRCKGFSLWGLLLCSKVLGCTGFSSRGTWAQQLGPEGSEAQAHQLWPQLPHGMWELFRSRIELVSLALQSRFLTIGPPGKSNSFFHKQMFLILRKSSLSIFFFYGLLH